MRDRLTGKPGSESRRGHERNAEPRDQSQRRPQHGSRSREDLPPCGDRAEARPREKRASRERDPEREKPGRVRGLGGRVIDGRTREKTARKIERNQSEDGGGREQADRKRCGRRLTRRDPAALEETRDSDSPDEPGQRNPCVQIAAPQPLQHSKGATQEDQRRDGHPDSKDETPRGETPGASAEFPGDERCNHCAEKNAADFGAQVCGTTRKELESAGDVAQEARAANPHVAGVAENDQDRGQHADHQGERDAEGSGARRGGRISEHAAV